MGILQRIELSFWHLVIHLIRESMLVRFLLRHLYSVIRSNLLRGFVAPALALTALGLVLGYIGGVVSALW